MASNSPTFTDLVKPSVLRQPTYEPGKPIEVVAREFGLNPEETLKLASNENPLGASPKAQEAVCQFMKQAHLYPDGGCYELRNALAEFSGVKPEELVFGNGSNEVIELVGHAFIREGDEVVMSEKAFVVYRLVTLLFGGKVVEVPLKGFEQDLEAMRAAVTEKTRIVFLPVPNNPTGMRNSNDEVLAFAKSLPEHVILCLDEAYREFLDDPVDLQPLIAEGRKVILFRTFSKIFGLAGFRIGYGIGSEEVVNLLDRTRQPFNVNAVAQVAAMAALKDTDFVEESREVNRRGLKQVEAFCEAKGLEYVPSEGNFMIIKVGDGFKVFDQLQRQGIILRPMMGYGLPEWLRISIGKEEQNRISLEALEKILGL